MCTQTTYLFRCACTLTLLPTVCLGHTLSPHAERQPLCAISGGVEILRVEIGEVCGAHAGLRIDKARERVREGKRMDRGTGGGSAGGDASAGGGDVEKDVEMVETGCGPSDGKVRWREMSTDSARRRERVGGGGRECDAGVDGDERRMVMGQFECEKKDEMMRQRNMGAVNGRGMVEKSPDETKSQNVERHASAEAVDKSTIADPEEQEGVTSPKSVPEAVEPEREATKEESTATYLNHDPKPIDALSTHQEMENTAPQELEPQPSMAKPHSSNASVGSAVDSAVDMPMDDLENDLDTWFKENEQSSPPLKPSQAEEEHATQKTGTGAGPWLDPETLNDDKDEHDSLFSETVDEIMDNDARVERESVVDGASNLMSEKQIEEVQTARGVKEAMSVAEFAASLSDHAEDREAIDHARLRANMPYLQAQVAALVQELDAYYAGDAWSYRASDLLPISDSMLMAGHETHRHRQAKEQGITVSQALELLDVLPPVVNPRHTPRESTCSHKMLLSYITTTPDATVETKATAPAPAPAPAPDPELSLAEASALLDFEDTSPRAAITVHEQANPGNEMSMARAWELFSFEGGGVIHPTRQWSSDRGRGRGARTRSVGRRGAGGVRSGRGGRGGRGRPAGG